VTRVLGLEAAAARAAEWRAQGLRVVLTNGVFDLLHPGHVRYLEAARREGDVLIVAVISVRSTREVKGPGRPVTPEADRAEILASLASVDAVVIFDDPTPVRIVERLQPDVLVKGADWAPDQIVGRDTVEAGGGRVVRIPIAAGYSTTAILERIRRRSDGPSREP
jgi:rfaE bifunctional protein nucleotidyltransferase chain/domain